MLAHNKMKIKKKHIITFLIFICVLIIGNILYAYKYLTKEINNTFFKPMLNQVIENNVIIKLESNDSIETIISKLLIKSIHEDSIQNEIKLINKTAELHFIKLFSNNISYCKAMSYINNKIGDKLNKNEELNRWLFSRKYIYPGKNDTILTYVTDTNTIYYIKHIGKNNNYLTKRLFNKIKCINTVYQVLN
jgi:hypothetical protein